MGLYNAIYRFSHITVPKLGIANKSRVTTEIKYDKY